MRKIISLSFSYISLSLFIISCKKNDIVFYTSKPTANFNYTLSSDKLTVQFKDTSTNAGSWAWDFGDGTTFNGKTPPQHSFTPNPIQSRDTTYFVKLVVTNTENTRKDSITQPVVVGIAKIPPTGNNFVVGTTAYGFLSQKVETSITFGATTDQPIGSRFDWNFGDGGDTAANNQFPTHTFTKTASYNVTLTITSPSGGVAQVMKPVNVNVFSGLTISQFIWSTQNHSLFGDWESMIITSGGKVIASTINGDAIGFIGNEWIWNNTNTSPISFPCTLLATPGDLAIGIATSTGKNTYDYDYVVDYNTRLVNIFNAANPTNRANLLNGGTVDVAIPWTIANPATSGNFIFTIKLIPQF